MPASSRWGDARKTRGRNASIVCPRARSAPKCGARHQRLSLQWPAPSPACPGEGAKTIPVPHPGPIKKHWRHRSHPPPVRPRRPCHRQSCSPPQPTPAGAAADAFPRQADPLRGALRRRRRHADLVAHYRRPALPRSSASRWWWRTAPALAATSAWKPWPRRPPMATDDRLRRHFDERAQPHIYKHVPFDPRKDFTAISLLGTSTIVLRNQRKPAREDRAGADCLCQDPPGPDLRHGWHRHVDASGRRDVLPDDPDRPQPTPYKGSSPAINDLLGGHIQVMFDNLPAFAAHIQAGQAAARWRWPARPARRRFQRAHAGRGRPARLRRGTVVRHYGPANLPAPVVQALNAAFVEALARPEVRDKLQQAGFNPKGSSAAELRR